MYEKFMNYLFSFIVMGYAAFLCVGAVVTCTEPNYNTEKAFEQIAEEYKIEKEEFLEFTIEM